MAPKTTSKPRKPHPKAKKEISLPLEKTNFTIIASGIVILILGYLLMAGNSVDGFLNTVVAPILLVLGYCVIIPYGILKKGKKQRTAAPESTENVSAAGETASPNIRTK